MIIYISLIILLIVRILIRAMHFSLLGFLVLVAYFIALIGVIGKVHWGLFWIWGTTLGSIIVFFVFQEGVKYTLILDMILLFLGLLALFIEKNFRDSFKKI